MRSEEPDTGGSGTGASAPTPHSSLPPTHRIRLGPPWDVAAVAGGTRHTRKFGRPRTLDAGERVWLVCAELPAGGEIQINSQVVGKPDASGLFEADVTDLLRPRNELFIFLQSNRPLGAVALEIRAP